MAEANGGRQEASFLERALFSGNDAETHARGMVDRAVEFVKDKPILAAGLIATGVVAAVLADEILDKNKPEGETFFETIKRAGRTLGNEVLKIAEHPETAVEEGAKRLKDAASKHRVASFIIAAGLTAGFIAYEHREALGNLGRKSGQGRQPRRL